MTASSSHPDREILLSRLTASRQWDRLLETALNWLAEDPERPRAHLCAAQALVNLKREAEAENHLAKALAAYPRNAFAHRLMAITQFRLKNYRAADRSIHEAIALNPEEAYNWYQLALMCYRQNDLKNGLKWVTKARELAPRDPEILNLYALCAETSASGPEMLEQVLALDPENAAAHNNLGVRHLKEKEFAHAEECFRRALSLDPTLKEARGNLFLAVKRRDRIYGILCAPRDLLFQMRNSLLVGKDRNFVGIILGVVLWLVLARFFIVGLVFWFGLVWPLLKFYEFLVLGDLRKKAGEVGATRGGVFGYRRWPLKVRLGLLAVGLVAFWVSVYVLLWAPMDGRSDVEDLRLKVVTGLLIAGFGGILVFLGIRFFKKASTEYHAWRRNRTLQKLEDLET